jgi:hypothetical protein
MAQVAHQAGGLLLLVDASNAFNAVYRSAVMAAVGRYAPDLFEYVAQVYGAGANPWLLFGVDGEAKARVLLSQQGVQQGDSLGPLLFALVLLPILQAFRERFPDMALPGFLDDLTIICMKEQPQSEQLLQLREAYVWLREQLGVVGLKVNESKSICLLPPVLARERDNGRSEEEEWAEACVVAKGLLGGVPVVGGPAAGVTLVGTAVGSAAFVKLASAARLRSEGSDRLLSELVALSRRDTHLSYLLLRLCYLPLATFVMRTVGPTALREELLRFDMLTLGAMAGIMQEPEVVENGPGGAQRDSWQACVDFIRAAPPPNSPEEGRRHVALSARACQQIRLGFASGGLGIGATASRCAAAFLGRMLATLEPALQAFPAPLRRLLLEPQTEGEASRLMATDLMQQVRISLHCLEGLGVGSVQLAAAGVTQEWIGLKEGEGSAAAGERLGAALCPPAVEGQENPAYHPPPLGQRFQKSLQQQLALVEEERFEGQLAAIADESERRVAQSRHGSQASAGAMAWTTTFPASGPELGMTSRTEREVMRQAVGEERLIQQGTKCGTANCRADQSCAHACRCATSGETTGRHNKLRDVVIRQLIRCGLRTLKEDSGPFIPYGGAMRMDAVVGGGQGLLLPSMASEGRGRERRGRQQGDNSPNNTALLDFTILDGTAGGHLEQSAREPGFATVVGFQAKIGHYLPPGRKLFDATSHTLIPIVMDRHGFMHPESAKFFQQVAKFESASSGGVWPVGRCMSKWRQLLSVTLQRAVVEGMERNLSKSQGILRQETRQGEKVVKVVVGLEKINGYLSVRLLQPPWELLLLE